MSQAWKFNMKQLKRNFLFLSWKVLNSLQYTCFHICLFLQRLSNFTLTFHLHALEKEMATHSSVLAWRIPGMAWWAAIYGVAQSQTRLKRLSSSSSKAYVSVLYMWPTYITHSWLLPAVDKHWQNQIQTFLFLYYQNSGQSCFRQIKYILNLQHFLLWKIYLLNQSFLLGSKVEDLSNSASDKLCAHIHWFFVSISWKLMVFKWVRKGWWNTEQQFLLWILLQCMPRNKMIRLMFVYHLRNNVCYLA